MKDALWKCVHRKINILIELDCANVGLRHVGIDLHFRKVVCDRKNHRRLQTGSNRLADIDTPRNDNAIHRRSDRAMLEIGFCFIERALFDLHVRLRLMKICYRLIEILLCRIFLREQGSGTRSIQLRQLQRRLCAGHITFRLRDRCLKQHRIDLGNDLTCFHLGIKIDKQLRDIAGNLASNLDVNDGIQGAGSGDGLRDRPTCHGRSLKL